MSDRRDSDASASVKFLSAAGIAPDMILESLAVMAFLLGIALAARKRSRRRRHFGNYIPGNIQLDIVLTTLAAATGVLAATATVDDTTRITSVRASYSLEDMTQGAGIGPIVCGVAHSDYTLAEVEAWIKLTTGWSQANMVSKEISGRRIRRIGTFPGSNTDGSGISVLNDGKPIRTKLNWEVTEGQGLNFWAFNTGSNAIATTVPRVHVEGKANLWTQ